MFKRLTNSKGFVIGTWTAIVMGVIALIGAILAQVISTSMAHRYSLRDTQTAVKHVTETAESTTPTHTPTLSPTATPTVTSTPTLTFTPTLQANDLQIIELSWKTEPEYVVIQNLGPLAQDMTGWTLASREGEQHYHFPDGYILNAGATVRVESFTGAREDPPAVLLWWHAAIWSNNGDTAELKNAAGEVVSSKCYGDRC
jgi:hypothetical protein